MAVKNYNYVLYHQHILPFVSITVSVTVSAAHNRSADSQKSGSEA